MTKDSKKKAGAAQDYGCPYASRRDLLFGLAGAGGAFALRSGGAFAKDAPVSEPQKKTERADETSGRQVADAPSGSGNTRDRVPFYGEHQAGVITPRPATGIVASFDVVARDPEDLEQMFRKLTDRIAFLTQGGKVPQLDPKLPPADSGVLGPVIEPDNLTITVGLGNSLFENRPWLKPHKPKQLVRMPEFPNDALDADRSHGDLSLQFSANLLDTNIHALRDIVKNLPEFLVMRWMQEGDVPVIPPKPDGKTESARNFLGFHDGSANPDSNDAELMEEVIWVDEKDDEPEWAYGGTYQAVRIIRNFVERWDRTPLREQERIIGRKKNNGAPLDGGDRESEVPDYAADPDGKLTPLDAHIRLANPRTEKTRENLMLRRPFNYSNGVTKSGQLDQGLLFIAYQADLDKGFVTVQRRLDGEPLEEYIKPVGGGFFYVLPGVPEPGDYLGRSLIEAASKTSDDKPT
ncbi:Deferrochelatase/peroxidase EfeB precursor [Methyloligella halotolerans]|uniref:Deferrochelatase n=1 Tax=Methyloligella halotolerans TaxID=1177755 RepID=A0A1E2RXS5_9HYPH|nr:iron uptake transporter deferrochelatase/peroxidase subunit [Methyloligella halotolerans]ODA67024.1 Deferrochelatase/peroxidase EfeB precursor [Methyloligella halotolerans]